MGDHTETIQVDYDPRIVGYDELLDVFWDAHDPRRRTFSRQYRSAILYETEEERIAAEVSKARIESERGRVTTDIEPLERFHRAEDYHQKYLLRQRHDLIDALIVVHGDDTAMVDSTAAARINGWLGGFGDAGDVAEWLPEPVPSARSSR